MSGALVCGWFSCLTRAADFAEPNDVQNGCHEIPGFVPSTTAPRDPLQRPGPNPFGQIGFYAQDRYSLTHSQERERER
jgi:hypothetical protein